MSQPDRIQSLDGLRGLAALAVVSQHALLTTRFGDIFLSPSGYHVTTGTPAWWIFRTPLAFFFGGTEAVIVFFVLSGYVLSSSALRPGYDWVSYGIRRTFRLWIPVAASLVLAGMLILITNQQVIAGQSGWLQRFSSPSLDWSEFINSFDVFFGPTRINPVLWTMRWEFLFSLALPVFILVAALLRRTGFVVAVVALSLVSFVGSAMDAPALWLLPAFLAGSLLFQQDALTRRKLSSLSEWALIALGCALLGSAIISGMLTGHGQYDTQYGRYLMWLTIPGALLLVRSTLVFHPVQWLFARRLFLWLGKVSFSLYLVHVPILIGCVQLMGRGFSSWAPLVAVMLALLLAPFFWRFVERPSVKFAQHLGSLGSRIIRQVASGMSTHNQ